MKDKIVFVTGGANGIGRNIVEGFAGIGARVIFCDTDAPSGRLVSENSGSSFILADVSDEESLTSAVSSVFDRWGDIDILINNAGISSFSKLTETSVSGFDRIIATNLRPVFITSRLLASHREKTGKAQSYGRIINIASTRFLMSEPGSEGYAASKGGIVSLTHALALSLAGTGITVNSISPGWIENGDYNALSATDHAQHPSGRVGMPGDITRACLFLADSANDFINGQNLIIDGGMTRKMIYI